MVDVVWRWDGKAGMGKRTNHDGIINFGEEQRLQFGVKELWRDGNRWGLCELLGLVRCLSQYGREFDPRRRAAMAMKRLANFNDKVTEGLSTGAVLEWKRNGLNEVADGGRRAERIEICCMWMILFCIRFVRVSWASWVFWAQECGGVWGS